MTALEKYKEVFAQYDRQCIRVYQAYNPTIAQEGVALQTFGPSFSLNRMTWIKPSFLWMMYRSNWGGKKNQKCILTMDVYRTKFDELLQQAVLTSPDSASQTGQQWIKEFDEASVLNPKSLPVERIYPVQDKAIRSRLGME